MAWCENLRNGCSRKGGFIAGKSGEFLDVGEEFEDWDSMKEDKADNSDIFTEIPVIKVAISQVNDKLFISFLSGVIIQILAFFSMIPAARCYNR